MNALQAFLLVIAVASGLNPVLTPGVTRNLTPVQVCGTKWGLDHRFITLKMKQDVFKAYGIPWAQHTRYEVDHRIPRELGGADNVMNLWPELWPDARQKDHEENRLHRAVCAGMMTLVDAQQMILKWGR